MTATITNLDKYREIKEAQQSAIFSGETALGYIKTEPSTTVEKLAHLYDRTTIQDREDLRGSVANAPDNEISPYRKSMFFQAIHYVDYPETPNELTREMILAIYYGSMSNQRAMEVDRLGKIFITDQAYHHSKLAARVMSEFSYYPYKLSGNKRVAIGALLQTKLVMQKSAPAI